MAMDITFTNCLSTENVGASDKKQLKEVAPKITQKEKQKVVKYGPTAARLGQSFEAVVVGHSGQLSSGAIRMLELAVRKYAERHGYAAGVVRGWWMLALCMEHAKGTASMVLYAAAAMDENRAGKRHDVRAGGLDSCFRADVAGGRLPAQFPRPLSSEELAAARSSSVLAAAFLNDMVMARLSAVAGLGWSRR